MAYAPIALTIPEYDRTLYANWWLKAYIAGTTSPIAMATDAAGGTTAEKFELNAQGFPITAGGARLIPFIDGDYDLWLFPTAAEADANDTTSAIQFADNLNADPLSSGAVVTVGTVALLRLETPDQTIATYLDAHTTTGDGGWGNFYAVTGAAPGTYVDNDGTIIVPSGGDGSAAYLRAHEGYVTPEMFGADNTGATEATTAIQSAFDSGTPVHTFDALYLCSQITLPDNLELHTEKTEFRAITNLNGNLFVNASTPGSNINIHGFPVLNSDQANQSGTISKSFVLSTVSDSYIEIEVTDCGSHGATISEGSNNTVKVIAKRVGKTAAGYGLYIFNSDSNLIWSDNDDFCIGLAIEASGATQTANNNIVEFVRSLNGRNDFSQSGAGLHLEQSVGGLVTGTIVNNPICHDSTGAGILLSSVEDTSIYNPDVRDNAQEGLNTINAVDFVVDGGVITGNGASSPVGYQAQVRIDDSGLSGSTGTVRNCSGSGTVEGVKMFIATAVDFVGTDFRGTVNDYNLTVGSSASPTPSRRPVFEAGLSIDKSAAGTIVFDTELTDQIGDYNTSTGQFIAPVRGMYHFYIQARSSAASDITTVGIQVEGTNRASAINNSDTNNHASCACSVTILMEGGDIAVGTLLGGTALGDVLSTKFGGFLIG